MKKKAGIKYFASRPKTQQAYRDRQIERGLIQFNRWCSPKEREALEALLLKMRAE